MIGRPDDAVGDRTDISAAAGERDAHRHYRCAPRDRGNADAIIGCRADDAGNFGAVAVDIAGVAVVIDQIPSRHHFVDQIGVRAIHSRIQNCDDHTVAFCGVPGGRRTDLREMPSIEIIGVVGNRDLGIDQTIKLGAFYFGVERQGLNSCLLLSRQDVDDVQAGRAYPTAICGAIPADGAGEHGGGNRVARRNKDMSRGEPPGIGSRLRGHGDWQGESQRQGQHGHVMPAWPASVILAPEGRNHFD